MFCAVLHTNHLLEVNSQKIVLANRYSTPYRTKRRDETRYESANRERERESRGLEGRASARDPDASGYEMVDLVVVSLTSASPLTAKAIANGRWTCDSLPNIFFRLDTTGMLWKWEKFSGS